MKNVLRTVFVVGFFVFFTSSGVYAKTKTVSKKRSDKKTTTQVVVKKNSPSLQKAKAGYEGEWFAGGYLGDWVGVQGGRWLNNNWVGQVGAGYDFSSSAFGAALDAQYYLKDNLLVDVPEGKLYFYPDVGVKVGFSNPIQARIRTLAGAAYFFPEHPVSVHVELGASWRVTQGFSIGFAGGVGVRYHF